MRRFMSRPNHSDLGTGRRLNESYEALAAALERYIRLHPTTTRWPGVAAWLYFQRFAQLITDCAFGSPINPLIKIDACVDALSILILIAQALTKLDYTQTFNPRRLRDLPNQVVRLISMINIQLSLLPPVLVQRSLGRSKDLVAQMDELTRTRGQHGPLLFLKLWDEVDALRDLRDHQRSTARNVCQAVHDILTL